MKIVKLRTTEYPVGILWNMSSQYAREIMLKIAIMKDVIQVRVYDLKDKYAEFVLECYKGDKEAYEGGYIFEKIENMRANNSKIVAFIIKIDDPTYRKCSNGSMQCIESREIKQRIRSLYSDKIDGYFFDNLIHMSDDLEETQKTLHALSQYEDFVIADYVRKGYEPIMSKKNNKYEKKTYIELLEGLRDEK